jgi:anti-anti-sigma factor
VILDVSRVEFLDSAGVHALFRMLTTLQNQRKRLVIVAPQQGRVRRLLEILDLPSLAWVCDSLEEAVQADADGATDTR